MKISNQEAIASLKTLCHNCELFPKCAYEKPECFKAIELAISALQEKEETVSRKVYEQISWERDIAVMQLKDLGYGLGEKIRTDGGTISRQAAIDALISERPGMNYGFYYAEKIKALPSAQPDQSIKEKSVDIGYLHDWYQNSVTDDPPVWTDEHIEEMFCDFYMIPRQEKEREEIMNEFDRTSGGD